MKTLLLDLTNHDLVKDASGNIAVASNPYSLAQDAGCAIRLFQGELWYNTTIGVPYWDEILGKFPPLSLVKAKFVAAAKSVPDVAAATAFVTSFKDRVFSGQVQITSNDGRISTAVFSQAPLPPGRAFGFAFGYALG